MSEVKVYGRFFRAHPMKPSWNILASARDVWLLAYCWWHLTRLCLDISSSVTWRGFRSGWLDGTSSPEISLSLKICISGAKLSYHEADKHNSRSAPHVYHHGQPTVLPPASVRTLTGNPQGSICTQSRQRAIEVPPKHYGKECKGEHSEARFCQSYECKGI